MRKILNGIWYMPQQTSLILSLARSAMPKDARTNMQLSSRDEGSKQ
jgi:hypothetical protein